LFTATHRHSTTSQD